MQPKERNIKLTIEYDGTGYHGWQTQKNARAISDVIHQAITRVVGETIHLTGASRTDAGVHAYGQVANFHTHSTIPADKFSYAINNHLPPDIVVVDSREVPLEFHSRFSSKGKTYQYKIYNRKFPSAILRHRAYHVNVPLNYENMIRGSRYFQGSHDFEAFRASGCSAKSSIRRIDAISLQANEDMEITMEITGNAFLYNMVRIISGTLVYIGIGKIHPDDIPEILLSGDRRRAGKTAPPHGLYLKKIYYD